MWSYDPDYVREQMREGFDPHLDLAIKAGAIEEDKVQEMKEAGTLKPIRDMYKMANYSCIYGVGAPKLADSIGISRKEAKKLIEAYWTRNWSIKQLPKDMKTKVVGEQMWLLNPVNNFWYSIRNEKDIFSTLNQGTGAFVFDCWVKMMRAEDVVPFLQYHDEVLCLLKEEDKDKVETILHESMSKVNKSLDLNVEITVDVQFGNSYADVH
jgi:DNA polymerase I-like protein with 3'-5' exonuclease and polymerase domains